MNNLTLSDLKSAAKSFLLQLSKNAIPELFGVTDGKAIGTYVEHAFHEFLRTQYAYIVGSSASGKDFPELQVDLKVTDVKQPQSSCPFTDATQKVYGLGYSLMVFVYKKEDDKKISAARLQFNHALFVAKEQTADYQTTLGIRKLLKEKANKDDIVGFLEDRNLPLDEVGRSVLADRILKETPPQGYLTISNALQWRLQYGRAITYAIAPEKTRGIENLIG